MASHPRWRAQRASLIRIAAMTACLCLCLLFPAAANAHGRRLQAAVSEETATGPLQESTTETPTAAGPSGESSSPQSSSAQSSKSTRREERRARRDGADQQDAGCSVDLAATPSILNATEPLQLVGAVSCPEAASAAGQTVTLYQKLAHAPGFNAVATTTTEEDGAFKFVQTGLEVNSVFYVLAADASSARASVKLAPQVTLSSPATGTPLFIGGGPAARASAAGSSAVTFTGTVTPADPGTTVVLQREYRREAWHEIAVGVVGEEGKYTIVHTFARPGQANLRVVVHGHKLDMTAASTPVSYQISRRRQQPITIVASGNPLAFGGAVTISGTVAGAVNAPVKLLAQTAGGTFAPVAETTTSGEEYSFVESPLQSTRYRVSSVSASSAILAEGVTYALSAHAPASSVQAGGQLSFTGTVLPAHEGQAVDLEAEDASGIGYHVIASGTVSSTGSFSISHSFPAAGTQLLRIRVPGADELESVAGESFKLEVTPA
jgi:hypothetical protein